VKLIMAIIASLLMGLIAAGCPGEEKNSDSPAATPQVNTQPIDDGTQVTKENWPAENTRLIQRTAAMGLPALGDASYRFEILLSVFTNGQQVPVPPNIGISKEPRFDSPIHTHNTDNVIYIEADDPFPFNIGHIFNTWGVLLSEDQLGGWMADGEDQIYILVDGEHVAEGINYEVAPNDNIVVAFGTADSFVQEPSTEALESQP